ncbi:MAG: SgcJ/EcaC family oxidoreductase [Synechococcaceae cyanobacterium SM1_2_3]|nr:SgcJ/EcaC family oxidoreductase [Synechococcaceae cyanobacterium SM1_2_3]
MKSFKRTAPYTAVVSALLISLYAGYAFSQPAAALPPTVQPAPALTLVAKSTKAITEQEIAQLFDRWNTSLQTGNPDEVLKNYADDAILLPTISNQVRDNQAERREYFSQFLKLKPVGRINERNIHIYGDVAIDSGIYTFRLVKDGAPVEVRARYTFAYRKTGDQWLIVEHHSSAMPESPEQEIAQLFDRWNASLQTGDPDEVLKNYAPDAILLPTVSNKVRHNLAEVKDYFQNFLKLKPRGAINERHIRMFDEVAIDSGVYTFSLFKDGKPTEVRARYTFVYHKVGDQWLISEHHSSMMPEKV